ncbi:hypothetical protein [Nonomuraea sp. AD125B]|uniref:hypothetical protein n=1 Tax=Nonomuraea sp. AD125B TaxID=3242897 RepID=UPI0035276E35
MITVPTRRCLGLVLSVLTICGCSAAPAASPTPVRPSVTARRLVDLTVSKVLIRAPADAAWSVLIARV